MNEKLVAVCSDVLGGRAEFAAPPNKFGAGAGVLSKSCANVLPDLTVESGLAESTVDIGLKTTLLAVVAAAAVVVEAVDEILENENVVAFVVVIVGFRKLKVGLLVVATVVARGLNKLAGSFLESVDPKRDVEKVGKDNEERADVVAGAFDCKDDKFSVTEGLVVAAAAVALG